MLNKKKLIATIIGIIILIAIVAMLSIVLTNRKQATTVGNDDANALQSQIAESTENKNSTWKVDTKDNQIPEQNTNVENNTTEKENSTKQENTAMQSTENNTSAENITSKSTQQETTASKDSKDVKGVIWLTFDDGPSATITPKVLDILKKENIKATFFVINYSDSNEHLLKREAEEGHTIGIHGYSHEYSKIYKSKETFMNNVYTLQERIQKSTGIKTMYTRFPGGSSNTVSRKYCKGIMTELTKEMLAKGFKYYDWNISSGDAGGAKNAKDVYNNVTKNLSKKRGNMVLMHDFGANKKGLEALPEIIAYAKKNGYTFAAIDDNTPMYAQHVNN